LQLAKANPAIALSVIKTLEKCNEVPGDELTAMNQLPTLIETLRQKEMLPAILFHMSQFGCMVLLHCMVIFLQKKQREIITAKEELYKKEETRLEAEVKRLRAVMDSLQSKDTKRGRAEESEPLEQRIQEAKENLGNVEAQLLEIQLKREFHQDATLFKGEKKFQRLTWQELNKAFGGDESRIMLSPKDLISDPILSALVNSYFRYRPMMTVVND